MSNPSVLGRWYADPLSPDEARKLLKLGEERESKRKRHGGNTLCCRMLKMIARYWLGEDIRDTYQMLSPLAARSPHGHALLELIYGQLLLSRHLKEGMRHLEQGFRLAANLFAAGDYLEVMNRHRLLRQLPLSDTPAHAEPLEAMLTSAKVIERMKQPENSRQPYRHDPKDTYG
ncbi:MAG: hypothetical protein R6X15_05820 [Pseudomonadota bacterium]